MSESLPVKTGTPGSDGSKVLDVNKIDDPAIRAALVHRLEGNTWEACAAHLKELGFRGPRGGEINQVDLWRRCKPFELLIHQDKQFATLKQSTLSAAQEAVSQVDSALVEGTIPKQSLPVVAGIMVDKFARLAQLERPVEAPQSPLMAMLQEIHKTGGTLKLEVTQPRTVDAEVVEE